ncbi:VOC family protein [Nakamurella leprariae]|uniref:Glyoxalase-like domain-containing protein n=1 Tax=Nakamurella leprariae TaxID=2803911 RepID=A0A938YB77_9ACTN|nr:VOC family protein [Nakamurella leprariae]MBM9466423.1 hypothetical protein [Nakamurella leprariae]
MTDSPTITLGAVNLDADDPVALAGFWQAAVGGEVSPGPAGTAFLQGRPGGFSMFFQPRSEPRPEHQAQHLDLDVPWGSRTREVERLIKMGATHRWDVLGEVPWVRWTTLADPEGNLFCVAEHPPAEPPA